MNEHKTVLQNVRCIWSVSAVLPSASDDWQEQTLDLHNLLVPHPVSTYFMQVAGNSMIAANIHAGDIIVVDRALTPRHKKIVVARVGDGLTLKRLWMENERTFLKPENPSYSSIEVTNRADFEIWGVVSFVIHLLVGWKKSM